MRGFLAALPGESGPRRPVFRRLRQFCPARPLGERLQGEETGIHFADSTRLAVCGSPCTFRNRVFESLVRRGRIAAGWFHGFKLHLAVNHRGEIMAVRITPGNTDERAVVDAMTAGLKGRLLADKGCISKKLSAALWRRGLKTVTGIRRNMRNHLKPLLEKLLLRRRFIVETLFDKLKTGMGLEHTRYRSPVNAFVHILSCLVACTLGKTKVKMTDVAYP